MGLRGKKVSTHDQILGDQKKKKKKLAFLQGLCNKKCTKREQTDLYENWEGRNLHSQGECSGLPSTFAVSNDDSRFFKALIDYPYYLSDVWAYTGHTPHSFLLFPSAPENIGSKLYVTVHSMTLLYLIREWQWIQGVRCLRRSGQGISSHYWLFQSSERLCTCTLCLSLRANCRGTVGDGRRSSGLCLGGVLGAAAE